MRNTFTSCITLMGVFTSVGAADHSKVVKSKNKPNVLFIAIDDLRPELNCYGATQIKSPNIDKLASESAVFNRAYCNVPVSGASRASLMTGILPTPTRFTSHKSRADEDVPGAKTFPQILKEAGYTTISNGKIFHTKEDCEKQSWSSEKSWQSGMEHTTSFNPETTAKLSGSERGLIYECADVDDYEYPDGKVALQTMDDLQKLKKEGKPFFLACGFIRPHLPFYAPKKYWDMYNRDEITIAPNRQNITNCPKVLKTSGEFNSYFLGDYKPKTDEWHRMMLHGYYASTSFVDKMVGDVLNKLEKLGLAENTIVVLWGDHGWHLGEHEFWGKHNTLHNALRIPLLLKVPGQTKGRHTNAIVQSVDIFPTLCELTGVQIPSTVQGKSFRQVLKNSDLEHNTVTYSRYGNMDAIVEKDFVYTRFQNGEEMLYDHRTDPLEDHNVAGEQAYADDLKRLRNILKEQMDKAKNVVLK